MEASVYTFLLVSTLGIIVSLSFYENHLRLRLKNEMIFHHLNFKF